MRIGILTTLENPLLPFQLKSILSYKVDNLYVFFDSKKISIKDLEIWRLRTNNQFESNPRLKHSLYEKEISKVPFYFVDNHNSSTSFEVYKRLNISCLFNAGTPRKLKGEIINLMPNGVLNIHPGLLPKYRGCSCVEWAILNDDEIGNTAHFMDEDYDTGPIIETEAYTFDIDSNYVDIRVMLYEKGCQMAGKILKRLQTNMIKKENCTIQDKKEGKTWEPIPNKLELEAIKKANQHLYKFQK